MQKKRGDIELAFAPYSVAMVTPFTQSGNLDEAATASLIDYFRTKNVPALLICGSTGEQHSMTIDERKRLYRLVKQHANDDMQIYAGVAAVRTNDAAELACSAEQAGVDGIMTGIPPYVRVSQEEARLYVQKIAEACALPILLYNNPLRTAVDLHIDTIAQLVNELPQVIAVKETGDPKKARVIKKLTKEKTAVFSGIDLNIPSDFEMGYDGLTSVIGNLFPDEMNRVTRHLIQGNKEEAEHLLDKVKPVAEALTYMSSPTGLKYAMRKVGIPAGFTREPLGLEPMEGKKAIDRALAAYLGE
jgi:4-hydroxy-tetrahydrodipicolinate synthase